MALFSVKDTSVIPKKALFSLGLLAAKLKCNFKCLELGCCSNGEAFDFFNYSKLRRFILVLDAEFTRGPDLVCRSKIASSYPKAVVCDESHFRLQSDF